MLVMQNSFGISNSFSVIPKVQDPNEGTTYSVQEGDTLRSIAVKFNRDIGALLTANPQLTGTTQLFVGQTIVIPPQETRSSCHPLYNQFCGPDETEILVKGTGFPPANQHQSQFGRIPRLL